MILSAFFLFTILPNVASHTFSFKPNNKISKFENWMRNDRPCLGDVVEFEPAKKTIAYFDKSIDVTKIELPDDGILMFEDNLELPKADKFQCARRKSPEDVFFEPANYFASFHDYNSWEHAHDPLLHMNMVPSALDYVEFFNFSQQFFLDDQIKVKGFRFEGKDMSETDFFKLLFTMEGQYKISIGHLFGVHLNTADEEFVVPNKYPVLLNKEVIDENDELGKRNTNANEETMQLICNYVTCPLEPPTCLEPVKPQGHCCQFCGAIANLSGLTTNINKLYSQVFSLLTENYLDKLMWFSLDRVDRRLIVPATYQLVLSPTNETTSGIHAEYDDRVFESAIMMIKERLMEKQGGTLNNLEVISFDFVYSKNDRSISTSSKIIGCLVFAALVLSGLIYFIQHDEELRRRISPLFRASTFAGVVSWKRGTNDGDVIELINPVEEEEPGNQEAQKELLSEEEEPSSLIELKPGHHEAKEPVVKTKTEHSEKSMEEMPLIEL